MFISRALGRVASSTFRLQANPLAAQAARSGNLSILLVYLHPITTLVNLILTTKQYNK